MANVPTLQVPECARCNALCCRVSVIPLDPRYAWDRQVIAEGNSQVGEVPLVGGDEIREQTIIARQDSGSCVYLDEPTNRCSIYARRPVVCRTWGCLSREDALRLTARSVEVGIDPRGTPPLQYLRTAARGSYEFVRGWAERTFLTPGPSPNLEDSVGRGESEQTPQP